MRNRCDDQLLSAFLDDELDEDESLAVARHVATCSNCATELEELRRMRDTLRDLPVMTAPPELLDTAARRADVEGHRSSLHRPLVLALVATAALGSVAWVAGASDDGTVVPPMDRYVVDHVGRVGGGPMVTPVDASAP